MSYSESEPDYSFVINSLSFFFESESDDSESDFNSVFINLDICIFSTLYLHSLNKLADVFFINSENRINSYARNAGITHIFFWYIITQKVCFYYTIKFSYFSF